MDFALDKKYEMAQNLFREFAQNEVKPLAQEIDENHRFPRETVEKMAKYGFLGIPVSKEDGGQGCDPLTYVMCVEELSKVCGTTGVIVSAHTSLCVDPIQTYGTPDQKAKYLPDLASGRKLGAFGLTEPGAGTDAQGQQTKAVLDGDEWVLNGSKCFITNGKEADVYIIIAVTGTIEKRGRKQKEISAFIVEKGTPGLSTGKEENKMGIRTSNTCDVVLEDVRIPASNLIGEEGKGFNIAMQTLDQARTWMGCVATGIAQRGINEAIAYGKERVQFGKPIIKNQALKFKVADMEIKTETARQMVAHALTKMDLGLPYTKESAIAKCYASDIAMEVASEAIQMFGGYGYSREYPVEKLLRDAKIFQIYEGTNQIQRAFNVKYPTEYIQRPEKWQANQTAFAAFCPYFRQSNVNAQLFTFFFNQIQLCFGIGRECIDGNYAWQFVYILDVAYMF